MRHATMMIAALALLAIAAPAANAQKLDANGRCHDAKGRFAKAEVCKGASSTPAVKPAAVTAKTAPAATPAPAATAPSGYKVDAKGKCRDAKGRMAKKDLCKV